MSVLFVVCIDHRVLDVERSDSRNRVERWLTGAVSTMRSALWNACASIARTLSAIVAGAGAVGACNENHQRSGVAHVIARSAFSRLTRRRKNEQEPVRVAEAED